MLRIEREEQILEILGKHKRVRVVELGALLYTSESSIRRDLTSLEKKGLVKRYYGGVELVQSNSAVTSFAARTHHNVGAKKIMAQKAVSLVKDGDIVFLDQSSSSLYVACELVKKSRLTVVTSSVEIIYLLADSQLEVCACGGMLSPANRNCLIGEDALETFSRIHADVMFFATKALSEDGTVYDCTRQEVCLRNAMMANADRKVYLCDSEKFGKIAGYKQCTLDQVDYLVCEREVPERLINSFKKLTVL